MKNSNTAFGHVHKIYSRIVIIAFIAHIIFSAVFISLKIYPLIIYNFFSVAFYVVLYLILKPGRYSFCVAAVHLEVALFSAAATFYLGLEPGYAFYLIALCSLVYFCPYRRTFIAYGIAFAELLLFLLLKLYCVKHTAIAPIPSSLTNQLLYCFNASACVCVILYAAYISNLSALFTEKELMEQNRNLQSRLDHDTLTSLYTRSYLIERFHALHKEHASMTLVMTDIDNFKHINDTYGHPCGDYVLFTIATIMKTVCPAGSCIARWGGEEFILLFSKADKKETLAAIQNLRESISAYDFQYAEYNFHVTATFGVSFCEERNTLDELVQLADERMYQGKQSGKNRVIAAD